jgi:hypothetical protein
MFIHRMFGLLVTFFGVGAMTCMSSGVAAAAVEHVVAGAQQRRRMRRLENHPIQQHLQQQRQQQRSLETTTDIPTTAPVIVEYWPTDPAPMPPTPRTPPSHTPTTGSVHPSISIVPTVSTSVEEMVDEQFTMDTKGQQADVDPIDVSNGGGNASSLSETNSDKKPADASMTALTSTTKEDVLRDSGAIQWTSHVESVAAGVTATAFIWSMWVVAFGM